MLVQKFNEKFIKTRQAAADADRLIVETDLSEGGYSHPVVVIGTDTDLLVMLISLTPPDCDMYMLCSTNPIALYNITLIQNAVDNKKNTPAFCPLSDGMQHCISFVWPRKEEGDRYSGPIHR